jgi:bacterial/archaeal transporter family protein
MENLTWFPFSIAATICFGIAMVLYKLPAAKNQSRFAVSFWQALITFILALTVFYSFISLTNTATVIYGSLWGLAFLFLSLMQMKALKQVDTNRLYPVTTSLSLVASVLVGLVLFRDIISWLQILGIIMLIAVVYLFSYKGKKIQYSKSIIIIGSGIVFLSVAGKIIHKLAADNVDIQAFQVWQYLSATIFSLMLYTFIHRKDFKQHIFSKAALSGLLIAVPTFLGGYMWLIALTKGPFSLVTSIHSLYVIIAALVAYLIFKEKLTWKKLLLIVLAVVAMIIIKIG